MKVYEDGGHAYHATMPTDSISTFLSSIKEIQTIGFVEMSRRQQVYLPDLTHVDVYLGTW